MPRIIQLAPDGGGRYIAVDRDGDLWRGETKRQTSGGEGVHRVEAAARAVPEGQLMIAAIYARKSTDQIGAGSEAIAEPRGRT